MEIRRGSSGKDGAASVGIGLSDRPSMIWVLGWTALRNNSVTIFFKWPAEVKMEIECMGIRKGIPSRFESCMKLDVVRGKTYLITDQPHF